MKRLLTGTLALFSLLACGPEGSTTPPPFGVPISTTPGAGSGGGSGAMTPQARKGEACSTDADCGSSVLSCHLISGYDRGICAESCATSSGADPSLCREPDVCSVTGLAICLQSCAADSDCAASAKCIEGSAPGRPDLVRVCVPREFAASEPEPVSDAGTSQPANLAEYVWLTQADLKRESDRRLKEGKWIVDWTRLAAQLAGTPVRVGRLVEGSDGSFSFSPGGTTLVVERPNSSFQIRIDELVGDARTATFPSGTERLDATFLLGSRTQHCVVTEDYARFVGEFVDDSDRVFSLDATTTRDVDVWSGSDSGGYYRDETGTTHHRAVIRRAGVLAEVSVELAYSTCLGSCGFSAYGDYVFTNVVKFAGAGSSWSANYTSGWKKQTSSSLPTYYWTGSISRDGLNAGGMQRGAAGAADALDIVVRGDRYTTRGVLETD